MAGIIVLPSGDRIPHTNVGPELKFHFPWCVWQTVGFCIVHEAPFIKLQKQPVLDFNSAALEVAVLLL